MGSIRILLGLCCVVRLLFACFGPGLGVGTLYYLLCMLHLVDLYLDTYARIGYLSHAILGPGRCVRGVSTRIVLSHSQLRSCDREQG